jgi:hypothetical protein
MLFVEGLAMSNTRLRVEGGLGLRLIQQIEICPQMFFSPALGNHVLRFYRLKAGAMSRVQSELHSKIYLTRSGRSDTLGWRGRGAE